MPGIFRPGKGLGWGQLRSPEWAKVPGCPGTRATVTSPPQPRRALSAQAICLERKANQSETTRARAASGASTCLGLSVFFHNMGKKGMNTFKII